MSMFLVYISVLVAGALANSCHTLFVTKCGYATTPQTESLAKAEYEVCCQNTLNLDEANCNGHLQKFENDFSNEILTPADQAFLDICHEVIQELNVLGEGGTALVDQGNEDKKGHEGGVLIEDHGSLLNEHAASSRKIRHHQEATVSSDGSVASQNSDGSVKGQVLLGKSNLQKDLDGSLFFKVSSTTSCPSTHPVRTGNTCCPTSHPVARDGGCHAR